MATLDLKNITKSFGATPVLKGIDLAIKDKEFVVFVGPSGCGKSTLLRIIAGLDEATTGKIVIDDTDVSQLAPVDRGISMVFQSYALYPHLSVYENIAFPLRVARLPEAEVQSKVGKAAEILQLTEKLPLKPGQLSGGQRQRVAIGRSIVRNPKVFLFDEPLSNLDAALRGDMRVELSTLHRDLSATMIYVTHDQVEAMTMADRIVVLDKGWISQVGTPLELYHKPANTFVAGFIGNPKMNFLPVTCEAADADGVRVSIHGGDSLRVPVDPANVTRGQSLTLGVRPEHLGTGQKGATIQAVPTVIERLGIHTVAHCSIVGSPASFCALLEGSVPAQIGQALPLSFDAADCHLFAENGLALERRVDMKALDPELAAAASA